MRGVSRLVIAAAGLLAVTSQALSADVPKGWTAPYVAHYAIELGDSAEKPGGNAVDMIDQVLESAWRHGSRLERGEFDCLMRAGELTTAEPGEPPSIIQGVLRRVVVQFDDPAGLLRQETAIFSRNSSQAHERTSIQTPEGGLRLHNSQVVQYSGTVPENWNDEFWGQPLDPRVLPWSRLDWLIHGDEVSVASLRKFYAKERIRFAGWVDDSQLEICWLVHEKTAISIVFDARREYLPVTHLTRRPITDAVSETETYNAVQFATTDWKLKEGIYVPVRTKMWRGGDRPDFVEAKLFWGSVNRPLDPQDFTLESLLLLPDTRILEKVNGKFVDVGRIDHHGKYQTFSATAVTKTP